MKKYRRTLIYIVNNTDYFTNIVGMEKINQVMEHPVNHCGMENAECLE